MIDMRSQMITYDRQYMPLIYATTNSFTPRSSHLPKFIVQSNFVVRELLKETLNMIAIHSDHCYTNMIELEVEQRGKNNLWDSKHNHLKRRFSQKKLTAVHSKEI